MANETSRTEIRQPAPGSAPGLAVELLDMLGRGEGWDATAAVATLDWLRRDGDEVRGSAVCHGARAVR